VIEKRTVQIDLAGARYRIHSDADEAHLQHLARVIDERISTLGPKATRNATREQLLAIVALGLADDLAAVDKRARALEELVRTSVRNTLDRIERRLAETA
jgi:cell division protein ZapA (FtsZ GTPase activity inhibitor)